jgi:hypothetical protein
MREREGLPSLKMLVECACVWLCWSLRKVQESRVIMSSFRTVPACSFYSLKEIQGYKMLVCRRSLPGMQPWGLERPYLVASWSVL